MPSTTPTRPGHHMDAEIGEQPSVWRRQLATGRPEIARVAAHIARRRPRFVQFVARGSSDHAALYGKYLVEVLLQQPAGMASPSTMTTYGSQPDLTDVLTVAVSQSGGSPDLTRALEISRRCGATTLAITNNAGSSLAGTAEFHLDIDAGAERAVAATKSYTAQLLILHLLVDHLRGGTGTGAEPLPDLAEQLTASQDRAADLAQRLRAAQHIVTTGRGYSSATAHEAALKLMETSYLAAQGFSGADLLHGPLAVIDAHVPVLAIATAGRAGDAMDPVLARIDEVGGEVFRIATSGNPRHSAPAFEIPPGAPEELVPLLEILPCQQLALNLALARGNDPDSPRGLNKITETL